MKIIEDERRLTVEKSEVNSDITRVLDLCINKKALDETNWRWDAEFNKLQQTELASIHEKGTNKYLYLYANGEDWILEDGWVLLFAEKNEDGIVKVIDSFLVDMSVNLNDESRIKDILIEEFMFFFNEKQQ